MINGTHIIISSTKSEADRKFFMDVLGLPHIDVGRGWIIFGLPPSEMAVHPATKNNEHEFYLMVKDIKVFTRKMSARKIRCS